MLLKRQVVNRCSAGSLPRPVGVSPAVVRASCPRPRRSRLWFRSVFLPMRSRLPWCGSQTLPRQRARRPRYVIRPPGEVQGRLRSVVSSRATPLPVTRALNLHGLPCILSARWHWFSVRASVRTVAHPSCPRTCLTPPHYDGGVGKATLMLRFVNTMTEEPPHPRPLCRRGDRGGSRIQ
jgi:hypothetical protein